MEEVEKALAALNADDTLTAEQYTEWLHAADGKFFDFFREYITAKVRNKTEARIIKLLEEHPVTVSHDAPDCFGCFTSNSYNSHLLALIKEKAE